MKTDQNTSSLKQENLKYQITCWKNKDEFLDVYNKIFGEKTTIENQAEALERLIFWKIRRCQDTPNGVLCTLTLLDVIVKDKLKRITDKSTMLTLYSTCITKFINFVTSFRLRDGTIYKSARILGIDSFIVDLRHLSSHGRENPSLDVFRKAIQYCLNWIKSFYWDREKSNLNDTTVKELNTTDESLNFEIQCGEILMKHDVLLEALHKNKNIIAKVLNEENPFMDQERWHVLINVLNSSKSTEIWKVEDVLKLVSSSINNLISSDEMRLYSDSFFKSLFKCCPYFMSINEDTILTPAKVESHDSESEEPQQKKPKVATKPSRQISIIHLTKYFVHAIAKHDYLKKFLETLFQFNRDPLNDTTMRRSARFWIQTILKSFNYFRQFCSHFDDIKLIMWQEKPSKQILDMYTQTLKANLQEVYVLVGTQILPNSLKFSMETLEDNLKNLDQSNKNICTSLLPLIHPPLSNEQREKIETLINVVSDKDGKAENSKQIYTIADLKNALGMKCEDMENVQTTENIWTLSSEKIDWSRCPIGKEFFN